MVTTTILTYSQSGIEFKIILKDSKKCSPAYNLIQEGCVSYAFV